MEEYPLTQSYFDRAKQETLSEFHKVRFWVVEMISAPIVAAGMFFAIPDSASPFIKTIVPIAAFSIWMLAVLGGVFLFSLLIAPHRQRNQAWHRIEELETKIGKPRLFEVLCPTTSLGLPINRLDDGNYRAGSLKLGFRQISIIHLGELTTITRFIMSPVIIFTRADGWETTDAIQVTPGRNALAGPRTQGFTWDTQNPQQWELTGLPLTMAKDELQPLPMMMLSVTKGNEAGAHFEKGETCSLIMRFAIRTDKGNPPLPDQTISLTRSDIKNSLSELGIHPKPEEGTTQ